MATHDYVIANQSGAAFRTDLNNALAAIVSNNSNSSSPSTTYAYQWWADTSAGVLKIRNSANNAWIELLQLDGTITLEDGTVSAPALANRGDLDTGVFFSAANTFNVATGGVERMELGTTTIFNEDGADVDFRIEGDTDANLFLLDAGNDLVNIGTTTNFAKFGVFKTVAFDAAINSANAHIGIGSGTGTGTNCQALLYFAPLNSSGNRSPAAIQGVASGNSASDLVFVVNTSNNFGQTPNTEMLRLTATKNLGIKQSSPVKDIHIGASGADQKTTIRMEGTNGSSELQRFDIESDGENARVNLKMGVGGGSPSTKVTLLSTGGITFNGDTSTNNSLGDYEEGTWDPIFTDDGTSGNSASSYGDRAGWYVKIGNFVNVWFRAGTINFSGFNTSHSAFIKGLPYVIKAGTDRLNTGTAMFSNVNIDSDTVGIAILSNTSGGTNNSFFRFFQTIDNAVWVSIKVSQFTSGNNEIMANFSYQTV